MREYTFTIDLVFTIIVDPVIECACKSANEIGEGIAPELKSSGFFESISA